MAAKNVRERQAVAPSRRQRGTWQHNGDERRRGED
jgi:hypothetical protein